MPITYFDSHEYSSCKSIRESRYLFFSKNWIQVSWQSSIDMCAEEPVSNKWLQNTSKWFNIFKKLQNSTLVCIQVLFTGGIVGEELAPGLISVEYLFMNFVSNYYL